MEGKACGVTSEGETAKCKKVVCDPSYLTNKVNILVVCIMFSIPLLLSQSITNRIFAIHVWHLFSILQELSHLASLAFFSPSFVPLKY
jgi:hypothetical protein